MYYETGMVGFGFGGMIFMTLFWIGFVWLIVWLIIKLSNKDKAHLKNNKEIIDERYAKGEITKKEYKDLVSTLKL